MKNNQNITQQIQTSLKHLGALLFLLLTVIVLANCGEEGGISGGDSDTTLEITSATVSSTGITMVFSERVAGTIDANSTTLTCTDATGATGQTKHGLITQAIGETSNFFSLKQYTAGETCTLTSTEVLTGQDSGATLPAGTVLFTGVLP